MVLKKKLDKYVKDKNSAVVKHSNFIINAERRQFGYMYHKNINTSGSFAKCTQN